MPGRRFMTRRTVPWLAAIGLLLAGGCSDSDTPRLADYLDELDFETPVEERAEVPIGDYTIPIALEGNDAAQWRLFKFKLFAVTSPDHQNAVEAAWERRRGQFQDQVLTICRGISAEELDDQRLATLKSRLVDMARPLLGEKRVHQLLIVPTSIEAI